jgi:hypothetical protein
MEMPEFPKFDLKKASVGGTIFCSIALIVSSIFYIRTFNSYKEAVQKYDILKSVQNNPNARVVTKD